MKVSLSSADHNSQEVAFDKLLKKHKQSIIYFYPKDNTPGCTIEAHDFSAYYETFLKHDIGVYGVSKDDDVSHCKFIKKRSLSIPLISDPELVLHKKYGAYGEKSIFGIKTMGTIRSTFLLDSKGIILQERRNVSAMGHVKKVLLALGIT